NCGDETLHALQGELTRLYDGFTSKYDLLNSRGNQIAFSDDASYPLLCALEILDEEGHLKQKADMFTKRTIRQEQAITHVETASEALAVSIGDRARVDLGYMSSLLGRLGDTDAVIRDLRGVIFRDPAAGEDPLAGWQTADEYLSGNVRQKLATAEFYAEQEPERYANNVEALRAAQPKDLEASEIGIRLGATWIPPEDYRQFVLELLDTPRYVQNKIQVFYAAINGSWNVSGKHADSPSNVKASIAYGTGRINAYEIIEDSLNLRDVKIFDTVEEDGKEKRVINRKQTILAQQKQAAVRQAFRDWIWQDAARRQRLVSYYNEHFNDVRPREYDGSHIRFVGMNPEISLRKHQKDAVARHLYGGNTLYAHVVGAGKTWTMAAAAMESKRLGLCQKSLFVVPSHLTEQWGAEFLQLYPAANILVATKKDFETVNRKKFCARIATGDFDAVILGHSQFEKIPMSLERQQAQLERQITEIEFGIADMRAAEDAPRYTIKQMESTRKALEDKLKKLTSTQRKDDVITFEELGVDRLFVDEAHLFKNLFLFTK
ncbi:MAG: DEAD/DEAH box helicase family protein, partial [Lawsonibacter sp.]